MTQATIGFQFGGQEFSEVIFFENTDTLIGTVWIMIKV